MWLCYSQPSFITQVYHRQPQLHQSHKCVVMVTWMAAPKSNKWPSKSSSPFQKHLWAGVLNKRPTCNALEMSMMMIWLWISAWNIWQDLSLLTRALQLDQSQKLGHVLCQITGIDFSHNCFPMSAIKEGWIKETTFHHRCQEAKRGDFYP